MITVPTKEEVDERYKERSPDDMFGFEVDEYIPYMSIEELQAIACNEGTADETLKGMQLELTRDAMLDEMKKYMPFAWKKADDMRGISANRSIPHYIAWTWLAGDYDLSKTIEVMYANEFDDYGKSILQMIREFYGFDYMRD